MQEAYSIVILTGAGISKESGLSTFRDKDGIWAQYNIEDVATHDAFLREPEGVHDFYNQRRKGLQDASVQPNAAHVALAKLEAQWPGKVLIVTQNIDDLHERAGSRNLIHMHGELLKARCERCTSIHHWAIDLFPSSECPSCGQAGGLRPHVVWFGETPFAMDIIDNALQSCGLFLSIGTSGNVYPAAGFAQRVKTTGQAQSVDINLEPCEGADYFDDGVYGLASEMVPLVVEQLLDGT